MRTVGLTRREVQSLVYARGSLYLPVDGDYLEVVPTGVTGKTHTNASFENADGYDEKGWYSETQQHLVGAWISPTDKAWQDINRAHLNQTKLANLRQHLNAMSEEWRDSYMASHHAAEQDARLIPYRDRDGFWKTTERNKIMVLDGGYTYIRQEDGCWKEAETGELFIREEGTMLPFEAAL